MALADKLTNLAELYRQGLDSRFLDQQLDKLLKREALECQRQIAGLTERLIVFEQQYHESSEDFLRRWQAGQTQDSFDYTEWASLTQARQFLQARLKLLET
ncbi:MAG: hypothetical protein WA821_18780 [Anaerolineales bacterium]